MKLYHGSNTKIDSINLAMCRPYKDFGTGFYFIGNCVAFPMKKTRPGDAQLAEGKFERRSHSRAKESQATLF